MLQQWFCAAHKLYAGKEFDIHHDKGMTFAVVQSLLKLQESHVHNKEYILFTDTFCTKPKLAEYLLPNNTFITGTVRANSKGLPNAVSAQLPVGTAKLWRKGVMVTTAFQEKKSQRKHVLCLSTAHYAEMKV